MANKLTTKQKREILCLEAELLRLKVQHAYLQDRHRSNVVAQIVNFAIINSPLKSIIGRRIFTTKKWRHKLLLSALFGALLWHK